VTTGRPATPEDIDAICRALPDVELGTSWGDRPTYKVPAGEKGRGFLLYRAPGPTAIDPATGEPFDDLLVIRTGSESDKAPSSTTNASRSSPSRTSGATTLCWSRSRGSTRSTSTS
jgi:hypothetical protein